MNFRVECADYFAIFHERFRISCNFTNFLSDARRDIYPEMEIGIPFLSNECATPILLETGRVPAHVGIHESTVD